MSNGEVRLDLTQVTRTNAFNLKQSIANDNVIELSSSVQRVEKPFTFISETKSDLLKMDFNIRDTSLNAAFGSTKYTDSQNTTDMNTVNINLTRDKYSISYLTQKGTLNDIGNLDAKTIGLAMPLFGGDAKFISGFADKLENWTPVHETQRELVLPFNSLLKGAYYKSASSSRLANGAVASATDSTEYNIPFDFLWKGAFYKHSDAMQLSNGVLIESASSLYQVPLDRLIKGASYSRLDQTLLESKIIVDRFQEGLTLPMNLLGKGATIAYHNNKYRLHGQSDWADSTDVTITSPLQILGIPLDSVYTYVLDDPSGSRGSRFSTQLKLPTRINGRVITNTHTVSINTLGQDTIQSNFAVPFKGGDLTLGRTAIDDHNASNITYTIGTPTIGLFSNLTSQANFLFYTSDNASVAQKRTFNLAWNPSPKLTAKMDMVNSDLNPAEHYNMNLTTGYNLSSNRTLNFGYFEKDLPDNTFSIQKKAVFTQNGNVKFNASLLQLDTNGQTTSPLVNWDVSYGDAKNLSLVAMYQRYDPTKTVEWIEPTMGMELKHSGSTIDLAYKYQGSMGRLVPLNVIDTIIRMGSNTNLQLTYTNNGLDPLDTKQQMIRIGHTYDCALKSKIGDFDLVTAIRNHDTNNSWSFSLGDNSGSGKASFTYQSGDFSPLVIGGRRTDNIIGFQYEKVFRENEKLLMKYSSYQLDDTNSEGRIELNVAF
jgi:hypothetical protein